MRWSRCLTRWLRRARDRVGAPAHVNEAPAGGTYPPGQESRTPAREMWTPAGEMSTPAPRTHVHRAGSPARRRPTPSWPDYRRPALVRWLPARAMHRRESHGGAHECSVRRTRPSEEPPASLQAIDGGRLTESACLPEPAAAAEWTPRRRPAASHP